MQFSNPLEEFDTSDNVYTFPSGDLSPAERKKLFGTSKHLKAKSSKSVPLSLLKTSTLISSPSIIVSAYDFLRDFPRLSEEKYPRYHHYLRGAGFSKVSNRVDQCCINAIGLDCSSGDHTHYAYAPIPCKRRTCPQCAVIEMNDRIDQFSYLSQFLYHDIFKPLKNYRLRFWTLTTKGLPPGSDLTEHIKSLKSALFLFWRKLFGDRSASPDPEAGGVFFFEVQGVKLWCPHINGLVWSGFHHVTQLRRLWKYCIEYYGLSGYRLKVQSIQGDDLLKIVCEIVSYPLNPDKQGRHDQVLLANVEKAFFGQHRYIIKGSFYGQFPRIEHKAKCPICSSPMEVGEDYSRNCLDVQRGFFPETLEGLQRYHDFGFISEKKRILLKSNIATIESLC